VKESIMTNGGRKAVARDALSKQACVPARTGYSDNNRGSRTAYRSLEHCTVL
jgi:hypothetical protein